MIFRRWYGRRKRGQKGGKKEERETGDVIMYQQKPREDRVVVRE